MEINKENVIAAMRVASEDTKIVLRTLFPDIEETETAEDNRPITERIKTFEDACKWCMKHGCEELVKTYENAHEWVEVSEADVFAYLELRIICAALNEGRTPQYTEDEWRYYPWFTLWTEDELSEKNDEWKRDRALLPITGEYETKYCGLAFSRSSRVPSDAHAGIASRLCLKSSVLAAYCGKQFIKVWADYLLQRKTNGEEDAE